VFLSSTLRLRVEFVDDVTNADQAPAVVQLVTRPAPGGQGGVTATLGQVPLPAPITSLTQTTTGARIVYEALVQIGASAPPGIWGYAWQALDDEGNPLVTEWGSFVVEMNPAP
jgi:hypothetical protein